MSSLYCRLGIVILSLPAFIVVARAEQASGVAEAPIERVWLDEHVAARRRQPARPAYRLVHTQVWASNIARSDMQAFTPAGFDRTLGAKLQPFHDLNFQLGTQLTRSTAVASPLSGAASWEAFWSRNVQHWGGLDLGLSTMGSVDYAGAGYSQSVSGSLGIPLDLALDRWSTQFRLSPSMNLNAASGAVGTGLLSEIMGQKVLASQKAYLSVLNVKVGYALAPDTRPVASAKLELRILRAP